MEHDDERQGPTAMLARRVRELRTKRGWSAAELAEQMQGMGIDWQRLVVTKLENGRRQDVSVREMLALAAVLEVAPVHLLIPVEDDEPYEITPGREVPVLVARGFVRGDRPLDGMDVRRFHSEVPEREFAANVVGD